MCCCHGNNRLVLVLFQHQRRPESFFSVDCCSLFPIHNFPRHSFGFHGCRHKCCVISNNDQHFRFRRLSIRRTGLRTCLFANICESMANNKGGGNSWSVRGCTYNQKKLTELPDRPYYEHFPQQKKHCGCEWVGTAPCCYGGMDWKVRSGHFGCAVFLVWAISHIGKHIS